MREDILLHAGKPKRAGYAVHTGKQVRLVDGIQRKQPSKGVPSDPSPPRNSVNLFLCRWNNLLGKELQIVVCTTSAGIGIFESRRTVPGHHVVVPVQVTNGHKSKQRTTSGLIYFLSVTGEGIEIDDGGFWFSTREDECSFAVYCEGLHLGSSTFYSSNCYPLKFKLFSLLYSKGIIDTTNVRRRGRMELCCKETKNHPNT